MKNLQVDWLSEGLLDVEYKQYVLLDYLQDVERHFKQMKLFPHMEELVNNYTRLLSLSHDNMESWKDFPARIAQIDLEKSAIAFERFEQAEEAQEVMRACVEMAIPYFERYIKDGRHLFEEVEEQIEFDAVGDLLGDKNSGYLLVRCKEDKKVWVFEYTLNQGGQSASSFNVSTKLCNTYRYRNKLSYERMAKRLNAKREYTPAIYVIESRDNYPIKETLLPVAKRRLAMLLTEQRELV